MLQRFSPPPRCVPLSLQVLTIFNWGTQVGLLLGSFGAFVFWGAVARVASSVLHFPVAIDVGPANPGANLLPLLLLPAISTIVSASAITVGSYRVRLLRIGEVTVGTAVARESITESMSQRVTYVFPTRGGLKRQVVLEMNEGAFPQHQRLLIYDPKRPGRASLLQADTSAEGDVKLPPRSVAAVLSLIIPTFFVGCNLLAALIFIGL
jgi:hypothetical protein